MSERWRKPATIIDCVESPDVLVRMPSGETMVQANVAVDAETLDRMLQGYVCMNCLEPQEVPFPERCEGLKAPDGTVLGCFYPMREKQLYDLAHKRHSMEEVRIGPRTKLEDEFERMREMDEFEDRTGIILPSSVKFPNEGFVS